ncbi:unnamed protein product [Acanthoscelides obtectus]|uniref:Uncharacterized protein n=1 Tax=Acanthoscelides obtectus TaxID=200917 RepID=A0A9P0Q0D0_ACAOB|nr:unnamed protein product [Acanthoscelides obtectus]CAK1675416.1 hypothetical protein AOBTE_LOCUS30208 [Acanthoscelides obtectus]
MGPQLEGSTNNYDDDCSDQEEVVTENVPDANNCDDSKVVFNNGKWSSYTPQQLKRPKTTKLSCTQTVQNKRYISVNYLLMKGRMKFLKLRKEKCIEEHNKKMELYKKKVQLLDLQINALDKKKTKDLFC